MRFTWYVAFFVLATSGPASASSWTPFTSSTYACGLLSYYPAPPPEPCPSVHEDGRVTGGNCTDTLVSARCEIRVDGVAGAHGFAIGDRQLVMELQVADGSEPPQTLCSVVGPTASLSCSADARVSVPLDVVSCVSLRVRAVLSDVGTARTYAYRLQTEYSLRACRTNAQEATVSA